MVDLYGLLAGRMALSAPEREEVLAAAVELSRREDVALIDAVGIEGEAWLAREDERRLEADLRAEPLYLAVLGRPNVGKSTLVNTLIGDDRLITGPTPGVTRDSIAVEWTLRGRPIRLIDTAGVRRWAKRDHSNKLEALSANDALAAMRSAHVVLLLTEAGTALTRHDLQLASMVREEGRGLIVGLNKCDAMDAAAVRAAERRVGEQLAASLPELGSVPCVSVSGKTGRNTHHLLPGALRVFDRWRARVPTPKLNRWLREITQLQRPVAETGGRPIRLKFGTQARTRPPTFVFFANRSGLAESYRRFLANGLRTEFGLDGAPVRLVVKSTENPYHKAKP